MSTEPHTEVTDEALARLVQEGDAESFGVLIRRYETKLLRYGRRFLARSEDIEDAVQDVFLRTYENMHSFDTSQRFSPWIYRIAHNVFVNVLRKQSHRSFRFFDFDTLAAPITGREEQETEHERGTMRAVLETALQSLDPKYREVLVLYYFEDMSYEAIADILHIPTGTVGVRLKRGKEALKRNTHLEKLGYGTGN